MGVSCRGGSAAPSVISCTLGWGQDIKARRKWELPPPFLKPSEVALTRGCVGGFVQHVVSARVLQLPWLLCMSDGQEAWVGWWGGGRTG